MTIKIEDGKKYVTRSGQITSRAIEIEYDGKKVYFVTFYGTRWPYPKNGKFHASGREHENDLVAVAE